MKRSLKKNLAILMSTTMFICNAPLSIYAATDISNHWAKTTIEKWVSTGYISGYPDNTFRPDSKITRAEFVVLVNKAFNVTESADINFNDVNYSDWSYDAIKKGVGKGYIKGMGNGSFKPNNAVTRQEAAVMIAQIKQLSSNPGSAVNYSDSSNIPEWSKGYIGAVSQASIMKGFPDGSFHPTEYMTRAQAVIALENALNYTSNNNMNNNNNSNNNNSNNNLNNNNNNNNNLNTSEKDVTLTKNNNSLSDRVIKGNLTISKELADSNISLKNVTVEGTVYVYGGRTINVDNCNLNKVVLEKSGVELKNNSNGKILDTIVNEDAKITGEGYRRINIDDSSNTITIDASADTINVDKTTKLKLLSKSDIGTIEVAENLSNSTLTFSSGSVVNDMSIRSKITITGRGKITTMTVYVDNIRTDIKPSNVYTKNGAKKPTYTTSSSSSGSSSSKYDNLTIDDDNYKFDGDNEKYNNVTVRAEGAKISDLTIYGDLTISRDIGNGSVTFDNVDVRGKVYVYGGGDSSITFLDCDLSDEIISDASNKNVSSGRKKEPVAIKFDNNTNVKGKIRILGNTLLESYSSRNVITLPEVIVEEELSEDFKIDLKIRDLTLKNTTTLLLQSNCTITTAEITASASDTVFDLESTDSYINTLNTYSNTEIKGKGSVNEINAYDKVTVGNDVSYNKINKYNETINVTNVNITPNSATITVGSTIQLKADIIPGNAKNKAVTWESNNSNIAKIDANGLVTGVKEGTAIIKVTTKDGYKTNTCAVTVKSAPAIDKTAIDTAIKNANSAKENIVIDTNANNVKPGTFWVTQGVMDTLNKAIDTANKSKNTVKTAAEVKTAADALNNAVKTFNTSKKEGTKKLNTKPIDDTILKANEAIKGIVINTASENVEPGTFWVTQNIMDMFKLSISAAEKAKTSAKSDSEIQTAVNTLNTAINAFNDAKREGTKKLDITPVNNAIENANNAMNNVVIDISSENVEPGIFWVTQNVMDTLKNAVNTAENEKSNIKNEDDIDRIVNNLNEAVNIFNTSKKEGSKILDTSAIDSAIEKANNAMNSVVIETASENVEPGTFWVTQDVMDMLKSSVDIATTAKTTAKNDNDVKIAANNLNTAIITFNNSKKEGSKPAQIDISAIDRAVFNANSALNDVNISIDGKNIKKNKKWVTQETVNVFKSAINTAIGAKDTVKSNTDVTTVVNNLNNAVSVFNNSKKWGTQYLNKTDLTNAIVAANNLIKNTKVDISGNNTPKNEYWVTQQTLNTLKTALNTANTQLNNALLTDEQLTTALNNLNIAMNKFNTLKKLGLMK